MNADAHNQRREESRQRSPGRRTRLEPLSKSTLRKTYKIMGRDWDALEEAATKAQGKPDFND